MYPVFFLILALIAGTAQVLLLKTQKIEAFLLALLVCNIGLQGMYAFLGHFFLSDKVAKGIGWPAGNPFQKEIAFTNLGYGILGVMCIWFRNEFWLATIIGHSVFVMGAGYIHILDLKKKKNKNVFNAGPILYFDIILPVLMIGLYVMMNRCEAQ